MKEIIIGDKYILLEQIGKGAFGEVYTGITKDGSQKVAIKIVGYTLNIRKAH
jgi:serine/threonine protein kinase